MNRITDAVIGFAVGDALGVPVEFKKREELKENPVLDMLGYGSHNVPKGTWSDDSSMLLATMDSICRKGHIDCEDIMIRFCRWYYLGEYTTDGKAFDIGFTTRRALNNFHKNDWDALICGSYDIRSNGNGSLMRIFPLAYYFHHNDVSVEQQVETVRNVSSLTHGHPISVMGCYIYTKYIMGLLSGLDKEKAYVAIQNEDYRSYFDEDTINQYYRIIESNISNLPEADIKSTGYVVDTLEASLWAILTTDSYEKAVLTAVNLGDDTDTVGALAGGLAGIIYGLDNIKDVWRNSLINSSYIFELCDLYSKTIEKKPIVEQRNIENNTNRKL